MNDHKWFCLKFFSLSLSIIRYLSVCSYHCHSHWKETEREYLIISKMKREKKREGRENYVKKDHRWGRWSEIYYNDMFFRLKKFEIYWICRNSGSNWPRNWNIESPQKHSSPSFEFFSFIYSSSQTTNIHKQNQNGITK
jgi:hypothetical protein